MDGQYSLSVRSRGSWAQPTSSGALGEFGVHMALSFMLKELAMLTLTNPMTILSFAAVFTGFGLGTSSDYGAAGALVVGVFIGSALWWLLLSSGAALFRSQVNFTWMQAVNRISGLIIFGFGLYSLWTAWQK